MSTNQDLKKRTGNENKETDRGHENTRARKKNGDVNVVLFNKILHCKTSCGNSRQGSGDWPYVSPSWRDLESLPLPPLSQLQDDFTVGAPNVLMRLPDGTRGGLIGCPYLSATPSPRHGLSGLPF